MHNTLHIRDEDLLLRPRETIKQLCPLLASSMAANESDLQLPSSTVSPGGFGHVTTEDTNLRLVNVSKALEPYKQAAAAKKAQALGFILFGF